MKFNITIIGAGPAGIACAIQLKRYGFDSVIFEKNEIGGLLRNANLVENYPGFPDGITGINLANKLNSHLKKYSIHTIFEEVKETKLNNNIYEIKTNKSSYISNFLVIASGTRPKKISIESEKVFYEVCELYKHDITGKKIAIIGSGDAAFDYALNIITNTRAAEVTILNRGIKTKCLGILKQRVLENKKIKYLENTELNDSNINHDYVLAAIGREPNLSFMGAQCKPYLIGDVKNGDFRQTAIAVGDGLKAAMEIYESLSTS